MAKKDKFSSGIRSERRPRGQRRFGGRKYLVVTEGVLTEPQYFEQLQLLPEFNDVRIVTDPKPRKDGKGARVSRGSDPVSVLRACTIQMTKGGSDYSGYFCVVDVDDYNRQGNSGKQSTLIQALNTAKSAGALIVVSNCSFEFWLQCHFKNVRDLTMERDKGMSANFPYGNFLEASKVADQRAINAQGRKVELNEVGPEPSTSMPRLIEKMLGSSPK